ncbi:E3 ubiquitin-protein ligase TRIM21-like [Terrapene carolina triunguis]|uniref:E3 ubiquitin-protein ligase TRIM21-like n=1 Tax=Terrapene triunguis TaxID=2587831 RepID=UPI0011563ECF|nr:E3 ubiquitin-protein ligase TRIM21-like [Terrapene carolina triunguis]
MAPKNHVASLQHKATCPICVEYFMEPVTLQCGHNLSHACTKDQTSICLVCHLSGTHRAHTVVSIEEAAWSTRLSAVCTGDKKRSTQTGECDTAHPQLILSEDWKSVRWGHTWQNLPGTPERFESESCVLGCEGFTLERHSWEVEVKVKDGGHWAVGVARESVRRKGWINLNPKEGIWAVECCWGWYQALTSPVTPPPPLRWVPSRIQVCLNCEQRQVTFFDAGNEVLIFTFPLGSVPGERIHPWLWVGGSQLRLCP